MSTSNGEACLVPSDVVIAIEPAGVSAPPTSPMPSATNAVAPLPPSKMPLVMSKDEVYFWTASWQASEKRADADIAAGRVRRFPNARAAIRDLLSPDD